jgi:hypothetical protein
MYLNTPRQPIHIAKSHQGEFTKWAKDNGFSSVQSAASHVMANRSKYAAHVVQMANFACNAKKWGK